MNKPKFQEEYKGIRIYGSLGIHEAVSEALSKRLPKGAAVADLGAGEGAFTMRLLDNGYEVTAFDINPDGFVLSRDLLVRCDLSDPRDTDRIANEYKGKFDAVVAIELIEHLTDPWRLVELAHSLLKTGGYLFITTPNIQSSISRLLFLFKGYFGFFQFGGGPCGMDKESFANNPKTGHINPISPPELDYIYRFSGFGVEETIPIIFSFSPRVIKTLNWKGMLAYLIFGPMSIPIYLLNPVKNKLIFSSFYMKVGIKRGAGP